MKGGKGGQGRKRSAPRVAATPKPKHGPKHGPKRGEPKKDWGPVEKEAGASPTSLTQRDNKRERL